MESLAYMVMLIVCAVYLSGPLSVFLAVRHFDLAAVIIAALACWLGIYWFVTVYTWPRYLGLASTACGLYAMYHVAHRLMVGP